MSVSTTLFGTTPAIIGGPEDTIEGTESGEWVFGTENDDVISALAGDDFIQGFDGNDTIDAGDGNDTVIGGLGDDAIEGGIGDDVVRGDEGADTFLFDPSREEGDDTIVDLDAEEGDAIELSAAGLVKSGFDSSDLSGAALDESDQFNLVANEDGDVAIEHPGGTITLNGVEFSEDLSFAGLEETGLLTISGLIEGTEGPDELTGTDGDDVINALGGDDTVIPLAGDDLLTLGGGRDEVQLDPSNPNEGNDVITDFSVPNPFDPSSGDFIGFQSEQVLAADPELPAADGDATTLSLADFDASENWTFGSSEDGNLLLTHPGGTVEFTNGVFNDQMFADLGSVIRVDGEAFDEPIAVEPPDGGEGGEEIVDGGGEEPVDGEEAADDPEAPADGMMEMDAVA